MKKNGSGRQMKNLLAGLSNVFSYGVLQSFLAFSFYAASCLALQTAFVLDYGFLITIGTLGVYISHKLIKSFINERRPDALGLIFLLILSVVALLIIVNFKGRTEYLWHLGIPVMIALLYLLPFSKIIDSKFIPGWIKPVSLAITWTWICSGPHANIDNQTLIYFGAVFFLILTNALIFDVKDIVADKGSNKSTFAIRYGWEFTRNAAYITLILSILGIGLFYYELQSSALIAPLILGLYYFPLSKTKLDSPQNHYYWSLDGALFLFPIAVYVTHLVVKIT